MQPRHLLFIVLAMLFSQLLPAGSHRAQAASECREANERCVPVGEWNVQLAVGAGLRTNPLVDTRDIPLLVIPQVSYYGERFFIDYLDVGLTLAESSRFMLNAIVTPGSDGLFFFREDLGRFVIDGGLSTGAPVAGVDNPPADPDSPAEEVPPEESPHEQPLPDLSKRRLTAMAGLEASASVGPAEWQIQVLQDVAGVHYGQEVRLAAGASTRQRGHQFGVTMGLSWKSGDLLDYYYGVSSAEAHQQRPAYVAQSGSTPFVRLSWNKPVNDRWRLLVSAQYEQLSRAMRASPLVDDNNVIQLFIGGVYHF